MALEIYNSLTKQIEKFTPIEENKVKYYSCGPTVYDTAHIGNFRAYITVDILKRTLSFLGYDVDHVMNLTDVDDKTIKRSITENTSLKDITEKYTSIFFEDLDSLNLIRANDYTKATDYIDQMIDMISTLLDKGFAYKTDDGSVYFDISSYKDYGQLTNVDMSQMLANAQNRIKSDEYEKEQVEDFALWKSYDKDDGDVFWDSPFGKGRPGWHIECSAMAKAKLGETIDIHSGGVDNKFPHHENEIAQSECANGVKFANYFLHNEHILVDNKKMSKSLGNFYRLEDVSSMVSDILAFKYLVLTTHYRKQLNFTKDSLLAADNTLTNLKKHIREIYTEEKGSAIASYMSSFKEALESDLNTSLALAKMWDMIKDTAHTSADRYATLMEMDKVLGLRLDHIKPENIEVSQDIIDLAESRLEAKKNKNYEQADVFRDKIKELGYEILDLPDDKYKIIKP